MIPNHSAQALGTRRGALVLKLALFAGAGAWTCAEHGCSHVDG